MQKVVEIRAVLFLGLCPGEMKVSGAGVYPVRLQVENRSRKTGPNETSACLQRHTFSPLPFSLHLLPGHDSQGQVIAIHTGMGDRGFRELIR